MAGDADVAAAAADYVLGGCGGPYARRVSRQWPDH